MKKKTGKWLGICLHHSAGSDTDTVESIRNLHVNANKWDDIGYHYVVETDKDNRGYLKTGRSDRYAGAHAGVSYYNNNYIGVCIAGNYSKYNLNEEFYWDLINALAHLCKKYTVKKIIGHREIKATECPGRNIDLAKIRFDIKNKLGDEI